MNKFAQMQAEIDYLKQQQHNQPLPQDVQEKLQLQDQVSEGVKQLKS